MPNSITALGLTLATRQELIDNFTAQYQIIYGDDINLGSDTPDGQMMNIYVQAILDVQDLLMTIYNGFDPDNAIGNVLDQRVAINGIQRQAGTYTVTPITIVTSASVNLYGLDQTANQVYTVADNAGNLWQLQTTQLGVSAGTNVFNFQAAIPGAELTIPNTITVQVTIVLGVVSVNNPTTYTNLGVNEESDAALKIRRQKSVSLASQGYLAGLLAALENVTGVTSAFVYENDTNTTDADGVPGHSIWVILAESGADPAAIANAIYIKRNAGCGMFGAQTYNVPQIDGTVFPVFWDDVNTVNLFIKFTATSINGVNIPNVDGIRTQLPIIFVPSVFQEVNINGLATLVQDIDANTLVTSAGFSLGSTQVFTLSAIAASGTFEVNYAGNNSAAINWNDSIGTIQTKVQAISGLSAATVTGSIASQTLTFTLLGNVQALLYATADTLLTSGAVAITFAYNAGYTNTLSPISKQNQFVISSPNIVIIPMQLLPSTNQVATATTVQFHAYGGYGAYTYSISVNNSGGSINGSTGLYTSGASTMVTDTVQVIDVYGDSITASVTVV